MNALMQRSYHVIAIGAMGLLLLWPSGSSAQDTTAKPRPEVEGATVMLTPHGFEPAALTLTAGLVHIKVYNRVGKAQLDLQLDKAATRDAPKTTLRTDHVARENRKWSDLRELAPGTYTLVESSNPKWTCTITVVPAGK